MAITLQEQDNGVTVYQVTENPGIKSNIYCEISWCSADSRYFVYDQQTGDGARNPSEYILCEFGTWKTERLGEGIRPTMSHTGIFYYRTRTENGVQELRRVDLTTGVQDALWEFPEDFQPRGWVAVPVLGTTLYPRALRQTRVGECPWPKAPPTSGSRRLPLASRADPRGAEA